LWNVLNAEKLIRMKAGKMNRAEKALRVIEDICLLKMGMCKTDAEKVFADIYMHAHVGLGTCKNPHQNWVDRLNKAYESRKDE